MKLDKIDSVLILTDFVAIQLKGGVDALSILMQMGCVESHEEREIKETMSYVQFSCAVQ